MTSRESKKVIKKYLDLTSDSPDQELPFKLHDFGARGVATLEQSRVGGMAHLFNFMGSDTIEGVRLANRYYDCKMAGFSIPASEHSTMTMWGREHEIDAYENFVRRYLVDRIVPDGTPKIAACVSDSFNIYDAVKAWCSPRLRDLVKNSGGCLVIRPDSGDPLEVLPRIFDTFSDELPAGEITFNHKGYKVLPPYLRIIQGDGINRKSMTKILDLITFGGWSASNIAFGSGGGLLQQVNRDTQKWAFKCCAAMVDGKWVDVRKDPATDPGKRSKPGRLDLIKTEKGYETVALDNGTAAHSLTVMNTVMESGRILHHTTLSECRARMGI
jgi:nicotinamide phosphoribosyltransferase